MLVTSGDLATLAIPEDSRKVWAGCTLSLSGAGHRKGGGWTSLAGAAESSSVRIILIGAAIRMSS